MRADAKVPAQAALSLSIDAGTRELVILITAREHDCQFEWVAHEAEAKREGVYDDVTEIVRARRSVDELNEPDAARILLGRELFGDHRVTSESYA